VYKRQDSGYTASHSDLANNSVFYDSDSVNPSVDLCGHGTHVAGTVAALENGSGVIGVNSNGNVKLGIVKTFSGENCAWTYSSSLIHALNQCKILANESSSSKLVVSMSLGGSFKSRSESRAFADADREGILSVAAAGNDGNTRKSYPASYDAVMSVAAVDESLNLASFSQRNDQVEIAAPGVNVLSTVSWLSKNHLTVNGQSYNSTKVEYSANTSMDGLTGKLLTDGQLCETSLTSMADKIVMCKRGNISFYDKVMNAQAAGAIGVVIYNNVPETFAATLGDGNSSLIPAVTLSGVDGEAIVGSLSTSDLADLVSYVGPGSGYEAWNGTSMATPHVSGIAAKIWNANPDATNNHVRSALTSTALDLGAAGRDTSFGYGFVDAEAANLALPAIIQNDGSGDTGDSGGNTGCKGNGKKKC